MKQKLAVLLMLAVSLIASSLVKAQEGGAEGRVPHIVSLQHQQTHFCAGAIIDEEWIVTSGSCVNSIYSDSFHVVTGIQNLKNPNEGVLYHVDRLYIHCNYNKPLFANDIALIHLNDTIKLNPQTKTIPLITEPLINGTTVTLSGWGHTADELKIIDVKYMAYKECKAAFTFNEMVSLGQICTIAGNASISCFMDSGGPLISDGKLVGVVNYDIPCAAGFPDSYSSILYYYDWINTILTGNCVENGECNAVIKEKGNLK